MADTTAQTFLIDVPIPSMGATVNELTIIDVMVQVGDRFAKGDKIAELESDKSVFEFEAPCEGILRDLKVRAGDIVPSGDPFMQIETDDVSLKHLEAKGASAAPAPMPAEADSVAKPAAAPAPASAPVATGPKWTPRAVKLIEDAGMDPAAITDIEATGPAGRVSGDDVARYLANRNGGGRPRRCRRRRQAPVARNRPCALPEWDLPCRQTFDLPATCLRSFPVAPRMR